MAKYRHVYNDFWTDSKIIEEFTPEDKLFYLYLLTNPNTTQIGIYEITKKQIAFELGYNIETVKVLLNRFENTHKLVFYNEDTKEIAIKNWGKYNLTRSGKPLMDCIKKESANVKSKKMIEYIQKNVPNSEIRQVLQSIVNKELQSESTSRGTTRGTSRGEKEKQKEKQKENKDTTSSTLVQKDKKTIINNWNELKINPIRNIKPNTNRHKLLALRIKEYGLREVLEAIRNINESKFLKGENNKNWSITFDWFIKPNNFIKVLENNYKDKGEKPDAKTNDEKSNLRAFRIPS